MLNRRKHLRKKIDRSLSVFDLSIEAKLGRLVDFSEEGFMLLSFMAIPAGSVFQLGLEMPPEIEAGAMAEFGAESLWLEHSHESTKYWIGFRIIDISPESMEKLRRLLDMA